MTPPGVLFDQFLNSIYCGKSIKIVETGCMRDLAVKSEYGDGWSTLYIARWVKKHPECWFQTVDINPNAIDLAKLALESEGLSKYCVFFQEDSLEFLKKSQFIDFAFLDSCDGLQHALHEFYAAADAGAKLIVMDDFETKAKTAVSVAQQLGWTYEQNGRYSVLRRPN